MGLSVNSFKPSNQKINMRGAIIKKGATQAQLG